MPSPGGATSPTSADAAVVSDNNAKDSTRTTFIPDDYLGNLRSRLSNVPPPKPATNPLQFVKARPCALYRSAQEQLKRSEQVKQAKEVVREDAEDWQSNLDNWKTSRRKRVEHIIDRVVEAKKLEQEEHNRNRRRSKTFSEMLEERGTRRKPSLAFYAEEEDGTEFSDTTESGDNAHQASASSADESGAFLGSDSNDKRELNSDKVTYPTAVEKVNGNSHFRTSSEDSSTTSVPDCELNPETGANMTEYTYEGAINDYKSRVINWENRNGNTNKNVSKAVEITSYVSSNDNHNSIPKLDVLKRSEIFEKRETIPVEAVNNKIVPQELAQSQSIKERLSLLENRNRNEGITDVQKVPRAKSSGDMTTVRERLSDLERRASQDSSKIQNELASCYISKCEGVNITSADLPLVRNASCNDNNRRGGDQSAEFNDTDREDSGIHTADVSCSVSQADEPVELEEPLVNTNQELIPGSIQDALEGEEDQEDSKDDSVSRTVADSPAQVSQAIDIALEVFDRQNSIDKDMEDTSAGSVIDMVERTHITEEQPPLPLKSLSIESETHADVKEEKQHVNTPIVTGEVMKFPPPLYQNVQIFCDLPEGDDVEIAVTDGTSFPLLAPVKNAEPPKEKPPPPPVDDDSTDDEAQEPTRKHLHSTNESAPVKRVNSTRRIRDELRTKRSCFLGIDGDESFMLSSSTIIPQQPPDMTAFLRRERQLEQEMYRQSLYYDSDTSPLGDQSESRDSGVELDRTQSDPSPWSPVDQEPPILLDEVSMPVSHSSNSCENTTVLHNNNNGDEVARKEREIIELLERDEQKRQQRGQGYQTDGEALAIKLRQLEQEKLMLERERARGIEEERVRNLEERIREQQGLEATDKDLSFDEDQSEEVLRVERELLQLEQEELRRQRDSLQQRREWMPHAAMRHYASAHDISHSSAPVTAQMQPKRRPPVPPAKPLKIMEPFLQQDPNLRGRRMASSDGLDTLHLRQAQYAPHSQPNSVIGQQMSRNTLHALSCTPRSRHIDSWVVQKRRSDPPVMNYNQHWLIQEAEQRRIEQERGLKPNNQAWVQQHQQTRPEKHLPNSVIQTLTQRVQNRSNGNGDKIKRRFESNNIRDVPSQTQLVTDSQEKMLSVSGKKKCSHCGDELGRGAAMIIESLQLFYHIDCFKCCVCRVQLGDGLMGTDVRVRNHKLHCHNCYSSDDGIKFSCV